jgi:uncharacterized membrane protein YecN with MAPEG domain
MITGLYAGVLGLFYVFLSLRVALLRKKLKIGLGDGGEKKLARAIRVHGNFSEYTPFILLLMVLFELQSIHILSYSFLILHFFGMTFLLARSLHAYGITQHSGISVGRFSGILLTWFIIICLSVLNVVCFFA